MTESLKIIATRFHLDMTGIYVWLDILSITQQKQKLKALAVNSLCTYASQADAMIIVAPDSQHHNQKILANLQTAWIVVVPIVARLCFLLLLLVLVAIMAVV